MTNPRIGCGQPHHGWIATGELSRPCTTIGLNARQDVHQPHAGCIGLNLQRVAEPGTTSQPICSLVVIIELTLPRHASQRGATAGLWRYPDAELLRLVPHSHHEGHR